MRGFISYLSCELKIIDLSYIYTLTLKSYIMIKEIDNILDYLQKAGLNTIGTDSPAWKLLHNVTQPTLVDKLDKTMSKKQKNLIDKTIGQKNGQKMTVGILVTHRTVPQLGLGLVVAESKIHKDYWIVQWCDRRYGDVGQLGIGRDYLVIV